MGLPNLILSGAEDWRKVRDGGLSDWRLAIGSISHLAKARCVHEEPRQKRGDQYLCCLLVNRVDPLASNIVKKKSLNESIVREQDSPL